MDLICIHSKNSVVEELNPNFIWAIDLGCCTYRLVYTQVALESFLKAFARKLAYCSESFAKSTLCKLSAKHILKA